MPSTPNVLPLSLFCLFPYSFVKYSLQQTQKYLKERPISEADIDSQVACATMSALSMTCGKVIHVLPQIARERPELVRRQEEGAKTAHKVGIGSWSCCLCAN